MSLKSLVRVPKFSFNAVLSVFMLSSRFVAKSAARVSIAPAIEPSRSLALRSSSSYFWFISFMNRRDFSSMKDLDSSILEFMS